MANITSTYKSYGFINYIDRWDPITDGAHLRRTTSLPAPTEQSRITHNNSNYSKSIFHLNCQGSGNRRHTVYFTAQKDTDFRVLMNTKFKDVVTGSNRFVSDITLAALFNRVDQDYGVSVADHGEYTMGELFEFNGDEYKVIYDMNYNFGGREARMKQLGIVTADNEFTKVFGSMVPSYPVDSRISPSEGRALCCNFIPPSVGTYSDLMAWNHKGYVIFNQTDTLTINKLGDEDFIVPLNDFVIEGINGDADVTCEFGRPMQLVSQSRTIKAGMGGYLLHIYK
jgi:hypothetical protein